MLRFESGLAGSFSGSILPAPPIAFRARRLRHRLAHGAARGAALDGGPLVGRARGARGEQRAQAMAMAVRSFFMSWSSGSIAGTGPGGSRTSAAGTDRRCFTRPSLEVDASIPRPFTSVA